MSYTN